MGHLNDLARSALRTTRTALTVSMIGGAAFLGAFSIPSAYAWGPYDPANSRPTWVLPQTYGGCHPTDPADMRPTTRLVEHDGHYSYKTTYPNVPPMECTPSYGPYGSPYGYNGYAPAPGYYGGYVPGAYYPYAVYGSPAQAGEAFGAAVGQTAVGIAKFAAGIPIGIATGIARGFTGN